MDVVIRVAKKSNMRHKIKIFLVIITYFNNDQNFLRDFGVNPIPKNFDHQFVFSLPPTAAGRAADRTVYGKLRKYHLTQIRMLF